MSRTGLLVERGYVERLKKERGDLIRIDNAGRTYGPLPADEPVRAELRAQGELDGDRDLLWIRLPRKSEGDLLEEGTEFPQPGSEFAWKPYLEDGAGAGSATTFATLVRYARRVQRKDKTAFAVIESASAQAAYNEIRVPIPKSERSMDAERGEKKKRRKKKPAGAESELAAAAAADPMDEERLSLWRSRDHAGAPAAGAVIFAPGAEAAKAKLDAHLVATHRPATGPEHSLAPLDDEVGVYGQMFDDVRDREPGEVARTFLSTDHHAPAPFAPGTFVRARDEAEARRALDAYLEACGHLTWGDHPYTLSPIGHAGQSLVIEPK